MENTILQREGTNDYKFEFYIIKTNEIEPYRQLREVGIVVKNKERQIDLGFNKEKLDELINYLEQARAYCSEFNLNSKPIIVKLKN